MTDLFEPLPQAPGTRRKENTRARLVRASLDVFVERGIDGATIDDITSAAGFTRGAFYSNFTSKEEVFGALFSDVTDQLIAIVAQSAEGTYDNTRLRGNGVEEHLNDGGVMVDVFEAIRPFSRQWCLIHSDAVARALRDAQVRAQLTAERLRLRTAIAEALQTGMARYGDRSVIPVEDLAQLFIGVFVDLMVREQLEEIDLRELGAVTIVRMVEAFTEPSVPTS